MAPALIGYTKRLPSSPWTKEYHRHFVTDGVRRFAVESRCTWLFDLIRRHQTDEAFREEMNQVWYVAGQQTTAEREVWVWCENSSVGPRSVIFQEKFLGLNFPGGFRATFGCKGPRSQTCDSMRIAGACPFIAALNEFGGMTIMLREEYNSLPSAAAAA